jgi:glutamate synthase domain-containing protein 2
MSQAPNTLSPGGEYRARKDGEEHLWSPTRLVDFRESVRHGDYARFHRYTDDIDKNSHVTLRSQLEFSRVEHVERVVGCESNFNAKKQRVLEKYL